MSEMVKRIARAIYEAPPSGMLPVHANIPPPWERLRPAIKAHYLLRARAAMEVLRDLTPAMLRAGVIAGTDESPDNYDAHGENAADIEAAWRAMIDESLKD